MKTKIGKIKILLIVISLSIMISGVLYLIRQYRDTDELLDLGYIILLIIAANILIVGHIVIRNYICRKAEENKMESIFKPLINSLESFKPIILGVLIGVAAIFSFAHLEVWKGYVEVKNYLLLFQFFVGIICGFGIFHLLGFMVNLTKVTMRLKISFFHIHSPEILFVLDVIQYVALITSIYVSVSISSILLSDLPGFGLTNPYITGFSIFSFSFILIAYFIPLFPISKRMKKTKNEILFTIEHKLLEIYEKKINPEGNVKKEFLNKFEYLIKFRSEIIAIQDWPFTTKWLTTTATVFIGAIIPIILKILMS